MPRHGALGSLQRLEHREELIGLIAVALRGRGIFVEGPITVPAAAVVLEEEEPAPTAE